MPFVPLEKAIYKDFRGGQNSAIHPTNIKDNELASINNYTINDDGSLVLSKGVEQIGSGSLGDLYVKSLTKVAVGNIDTFAFQYGRGVFINDFVTILSNVPVSNGSWTKFGILKIANVRFTRGSEAHLQVIPHSLNVPRFWQPGIFGATDRSLFLERGCKNLLLDSGFENAHEINAELSPWRVTVSAGATHEVRKSTRALPWNPAVSMGQGRNLLLMRLTSLFHHLSVRQSIMAYQHAGRKVSLSFWYAAQVTTSHLRLRIFFHDIAGRFVGGTTMAVISGTWTTSTGVYYSVPDILLPSSTHSITVEFETTTDATAGSSITALIDMVQLEVYPTSTSWCVEERDEENLFINSRSLFPMEGTIEFRLRPFYVYAPLEEYILNDLIWGGVEDGFVIRRVFRVSGYTEPVWTPSTAISLGSFRRPTVNNQRVYECTTAGTTGTVEPAWPTAAGAMVIDGTVVWTCRLPWYLQAEFISENIRRIETIIVYNINTVYYIALRWTASAVTLFLNGRPIGSLTLSVIPPSAEIILRGEGIYDDFRVSSTALTDDQILAAWTAGIPTLSNSISEYKLDFEGDLLADKYFQGEWVSNTIDTLTHTTRITNIIRKMRVLNIPVKVEVRFSIDGLTWGTWIEIDNLGRVIQTPLRFCQIRVSFLEIHRDIMWSHDFSQLRICEYRVLNTFRRIGMADGESDILNYRDGILFTSYPRNPWRWKICEDADGSAQYLLGSPPDTKYIEEVNNMYFLMNSKEYPNAVFVSDILDPKKWAFYNMFEVGDYDEIIDACKFKDYLIIGKKNNIWALVGRVVAEFRLEKIHDIGVVGKSLLEAESGLFFISNDGLYVSDLAKPVNITEKIKDIWDRVNKSRLSEVVAHYHQQKVYMTLPIGPTGFITIILNILTGAYTTYDMATPASFASIMRDNQYKIIAGIVGRIAILNEKHNNLGVDITGSIRTKDYDLGDPNLVKVIRRVVLHLTSAPRAGILEIFPVIDGVVQKRLPIIVQYDEYQTEKLFCIIPALVNVFRCRTIGFVIRQKSDNGGITIRGLNMEFWREFSRRYENA